MSARDIENDDYYVRGDYIGKQGIEKSFENYLRGQKGVEILLRDAHGRIQGHYMGGKLDRAAIPGRNLTLGIDIDLQALGEKLMKNKIGAIVAIEPETGEILCLVSSPTFDPHMFFGLRFIVFFHIYGFSFTINPFNIGFRFYICFLHLQRDKSSCECYNANVMLSFFILDLF